VFQILDMLLRFEAARVHCSAYSDVLLTGPSTAAWEISLALSGCQDDKGNEKNVRLSTTSGG